MMRCLIMTVLGMAMLMLPVSALSCSDRPLSIDETYGSKCFQALDEHFGGHQAVSQLGIYSDGSFDLGRFYHHSDLPHVILHLIQWLDLQMEAHSKLTSGHLLDEQAKEAGRGFRMSSYGRACP